MAFKLNVLVDGNKNEAERAVDGSGEEGCVPECNGPYCLYNECYTAPCTYYRRSIAPQPDSSGKADLKLDDKLIQI